MRFDYVNLNKSHDDNCRSRHTIRRNDTRRQCCHYVLVMTLGYFRDKTVIQENNIESPNHSVTRTSIFSKDTGVDKAAARNATKLPILLSLRPHYPNTGRQTRKLCSDTQVILDITKRIGPDRKEHVSIHGITYIPIHKKCI